MGLSIKAFVLLCLAAAGCWAQEGSITGSIHDESGAAVPNASVTITNNQQGFTRVVVSNASGDYLVPGLPAGSYSVNVKASGFQQFVVNDLILRVAEKARADATLKIGQVSSEVTVQGVNVAQVQTESAELSGTITNKQMNQLVLNGRNFTQLITLIPGVSNQTGQDEGTVGVYGNVAFSVNGGRTEYNNWELDGGDNMDNGSNVTLNSYPNVDAIAEVKVLTSNYGAQYGRNGSATIETVTKSGTREFHGDVFEFLRNDAFNARKYFDPTTPVYKKHDFGYTLGGPVIIPKFYNTSRQKTFFFFSEQWRKELVPGETFNQQVPSNEERGGDFSDVCPAAGSAIDSKNFPSCPVDPTTGFYFPNNKVGVTPQAQVLSRLIPAATTGLGASSFYNAAPAQKTNFREELVRIDQNFSDRQRFFFRFIHDSWDTVTPTPLWGTGGSFPTVGTSFVGPGVSMVANLTSTISPTLLNEFVFSYTTDHITLNAIGPVQRPDGFDLPGIYDNGFRGLLPNVIIQNTAAYGGGFTAGTGYFPWTNSNPTFTFKDNMTKIWGTHNLLFGAAYIAAQKNEENSNFQDAQGTLTFDGTNSAISTGNGFADFLLGRIASFDQTNQLLKYYNRYKILEPYIQDDWHVNDRLTLNLGLRISLFGTYREKYKQAYAWQAGAYDPTQIALDDSGNVVGNQFSGLVQCGARGIPAGCLNGHLFNPAPRVGFAYDPMGDGKTSIRGGYGIFFEHTNGNESNTESLEGSAPLVQNTSVFNVPSYTGIPTATSGGNGPLNVISLPTKAIWPYVQQWNFSVQRDLPSHTLLTVAYAGSKGTHLTNQRDINQLYPTPASENPYLAGHQVINTDTDCGNPVTVDGNPVTGQAAVNLQVACGVNPNLFRPYQGFGNITLLEDQANSIYNALQVSARRNIGGLTISLAYSWSHSIDNFSDRGDSTFVDSYDLRANRASSNFDQRHLLNFSYVYDLPFFVQRSVLHTVLGGWQWSGLVTYQTGTPFTITNGTVGDNAGVANNLGSGSYVDIVGNPSANVSNAQVIGAGPLLYNPTAFTEPTGLTFGDSGRNAFTNPSRTNFDMGLFKRFALKSETRAVEFRAEAFNIFNHTQFLALNDPNANSNDHVAPCNGGCVDNGVFLRPTGAHNPRILQFGLKLLF